MGGVDKTRLVVGDAALLDRVLDAAAHAGRIVVVGPERPVGRPVTWTQERPAGGGPAPAVREGLRHVTAPYVVLLAADLPFLTPVAVDDLVDRVGEDDGAVPVDASGRPQWLCSAWRTSALADAAGDAATSLRRLLGVRRFRPIPVDGDGDGVTAYADCDTPEQLRRAREQR